MQHWGLTSFICWWFARKCSMGWIPILILIPWWFWIIQLMFAKFFRNCQTCNTILALFPQNALRFWYQIRQILNRGCQNGATIQYACDIYYISFYHLILKLVTVKKQQVKDSQRREKGNHTKCHTVLVSSKSRDHDLPPYFKV